MQGRKTSVLLTLLGLGALYFAFFWFPNSVGARDLNMLFIFNGDEAAQYPHMLRMLLPGKTLAQWVYRFIAYQQYVYGFPYFFYATVAGLLPVQLLGGMGNVSLHMASLRQVVSVLPMIVAVFLLVYLQTGFESHARAILLFALLLLIPEVVQNDLWLHPESLVFLFIVLTLFFLVRDNLALGRNFLLAALFCGLAIAVKLIGLFFFLAIPMYIYLAWRRAHIPARKCLAMAVGFVAIMAMTFTLANPFLYWESQREFALKIQTRMHDSLTAGFIVASEKDPRAWLGVISGVYAAPACLILSLAALSIGSLCGSRRLINLLIAAWAVPFAVYLAWGLAVHAKHFPLPIVLPVLSTLPAYFAFVSPSRFAGPVRDYLRLNGWRLVFSVAGLVAVGWQLVFSLKIDIPMYLNALHRESNSSSLRFYTELDQSYLSRIVLERPLVVFRDITVYMPDSQRFVVHFKWGVAGYGDIQNIDPDMIILSKQHMHDYTQPYQLDNALEPDFADAYRFYSDALNGNIEGYTMLYQDGFGMAFLRTDIYDSFFQ